MQGSLEATPTNYHFIHDIQGNNVDFDGAAPNLRIEQLQEGPLAIRPNITGGDGTTALTITLIETQRGQGY
jgi:hypothetical protein